MSNTLTTGRGKFGSLLVGGRLIFSGSAAPQDGVTGADIATPGSLYIRTATGAVYANTNTTASPTWTQLGTVTALANTHIFVGNAGGAAADVALSGDATLANTGALTLSSAVIQTKSVAISNAAWKALNTTPLEILAATAVGAGKYLIVHQAVVTMTYGGTNQFTGGGIVSVVDHGTHNAVHTGGIAAATVQAAASFAYALGPLAGATGTTRPLNTGIDIEAATGNFTGNAAGDNVGSVTVWYSIGTV